MAKTIAFDIEIDARAAASTIGGLEDGIASMREDLAGLKIGSDEFNRMAASIQKAESRVKDLDLQFEALDFEQKLTAGFDALSGVAGAFAAAEGASALFGAESEALEETLIRVSGALALAQGLRDIGNGIVAFRKMGGAVAVLNKATKVATVVQKAFNVALKDSPVFLLFGVLTAVAGAVYGLVKAFENWGKTIDKASIKAEKLEEINAKAAESYGAQVALLDKYTEIAQDATRSDKERAQAVSALEKELGVANGTLGDQNGLTEEAIKLINQHKASLIALAEEKAAQELLNESVKAQLEAEGSTINDNTTWYDGLTASIFGQTAAINDAIERREESIKTTKTATEALAELVLTKQKEADTVRETEAGKKQAADEAAKAEADRAKAAEEASKRRAEARKKEADELRKLEEENATAIQAEEDAAFLASFEISEKNKELKKEEIATEEEAIEALAKLRQERLNKDLDAKAEALEQRRLQFVEEAEIAKEHADLMTELEKEWVNDIAAINEEFRQKEIDAENARREAEISADLAARNAKIDNAQTAVDFLNASADAFIKDEAKREKVRKALAVAQIAIDTARAISAAIAAGAGVPFPGNIPAILSGVTAVLSGIVQAKSILGESGTTDVSAAIGGAGAAAGGAPIDPLTQASTLIDIPTSRTKARTASACISRSTSGPTRTSPSSRSARRPLQCST